MEKVLLSLCGNAWEEDPVVVGEKRSAVYGEQPDGRSLRLGVVRKFPRRSSNKRDPPPRDRGGPPGRGRGNSRCKCPKSGTGSSVPSSGVCDPAGRRGWDCFHPS